MPVETIHSESEATLRRIEMLLAGILSALEDIERNTR